ncbi:acyl carrier protein [Neomicrococcus aestuarii]|uniref:Acyl carrier protein n=1 Tax=Neomicrococcus aestuarii TaxID=556325 RepID=A0A1L2ZLT3_9MICC|nr:acyl carrier protein [Neomicrococcus aestuarii]APF39971.1 acyl carrier protein [Neomicrococcus aestuarii]MBB5512102.1 acyl carrier protein [Neomicrococcus aestuarii]
MASNEEILAGLAEIVNEETGLETSDVQLEKSFTEDLDIDSISMMTIVVNAEDKFGVKIPDEEVKNLKTVGDAVDFISKAQDA